MNNCPYRHDHHQGLRDIIELGRRTKSWNPHLSKDQGIAIKAGDRVEVGTPGGGGFGDPANRTAQNIQHDLDNGYYTQQQIDEMYGLT